MLALSNLCELKEPAQAYCKFGRMPRGRDDASPVLSAHVCQPFVKGLLATTKEKELGDSVT